MAKSLNQVMLMGNLTGEPIIKQTTGGSNVTQFSLAMNRSYKDGNDNWQEATDYVDVVAWGKLAEQVFDRLEKGSRVLVSGRIQSRVWEKDGVKKNKVEILAQDVTFLSKAEAIEVNYQ